METDSSADGVVKMRSIYASSPDDAESKSDAAPRANEAPPETGVVDRFNENDTSEEEALYPIQLPQSTHSLLFTEPVFSLPFGFAVGILSMSFLCLGFAFYDNVANEDPANVSPAVRWAQYLSILIALLMEEEIPTGLYLLRMIPKQSLRQKFPQMKYRKFVFSSIIRIFNGYFFLANVALILGQASAVIDIFYDVVALQFVQQLDDIAFRLAKMDVFGKGLRRACTAKCFRAEFAKQRLGRNKKISIFLKAIYFLNLCGMLGYMVYVSTMQRVGSYHCSDINVDFGTTVWETALVTTSSQDEEWTLVYSYFNGDYEQSGFHGGRPVYKEKRKFDRTQFEVKTVVPAQIKYCKEIKAWVFTHENISKSKSSRKAGCNWLLRSPKTTEFNLMNVVGNWQVWVGTIGKAEVNIACNECDDESDCNLNGQCIQSKCSCDSKDGVQHLGTRCENSLEDSCRTIIGERLNQTFSVEPLSMWGGDRNELFQEYSRPVYSTYREGIPGIADAAYLLLIYTGNRWFGSYFPVKDVANLTSEYVEAWWSNYHAFWTRAYSPELTWMVSSPTSGSTPVGLDFYEIHERGKQFGPFGALYPIQLNNQTGRGYFRCGGSDFKSGNVPASDTVKYLEVDPGGV